MELHKQWQRPRDGCKDSLCAERQDVLFFNAIHTRVRGWPGRAHSVLPCGLAVGRDKQSVLCRWCSRLGCIDLQPPCQRQTPFISCSSHPQKRSDIDYFLYAPRIRCFPVMLFPSTFPKTTFFFFFFLTSSKLSERGMLTGRMLVLEITAEAGGVFFKNFFHFGAWFQTTGRTAERSLLRETASWPSLFPQQWDNPSTKPRFLSFCVAVCRRTGGSGPLPWVCLASWHPFSLANTPIKQSGAENKAGNPIFKGQSNNTPVYPPLWGLTVHHWLVLAS